MLKPIPVVLSPYDPKWPARAEALSKKLLALGPYMIKTHHIGSTSVPGLVAKPIIDMMVVVTDLHVLDQDRQLVEAIGFKWHGEFGIEGRRFCTLTAQDGARVSHLHFFQKNSPHVAANLVFRDYLRAHPAAARAYEREKRRAQNLQPNDTVAYSKEKAAWIERTLTKALQWHTHL